MSLRIASDTARWPSIACSKKLSGVAYFSSLAAITVYSQILMGAAAMYQGLNSGLMTTYTLNALTIGHNNFLSACARPSVEAN